MDDPTISLCLWSSSTNELPENNLKSKKTETDYFSCLPPLESPEADLSQCTYKNTKLTDHQHKHGEFSSTLNDASQHSCTRKVIEDKMSTDKKIEIENTDVPDAPDTSSPQLNNSLVRMFESSMFTVELALHYLYTEKDHNIRVYLGEKLLMFQAKDVDFYLLQLVSMFIHMERLSLILQKYFLQRCQYDVLFSLQLAWLLNSNMNDSWLPREKLYKASRMFYVIKNEEIRPPQSLPGSKISNSSSQYLLSSDSKDSTGGKITMGDLCSGRAFDSGCTCLLSTAPCNIPVCSCSSPRLSAQDFFLHALGSISSKLLKYASRALKTSHLHAELSQINLNLPARICLPLHATPHHVVRIPASEAVVLNSKSKAPYIVLVEVLECDHTYLSPLPDKYLKSGAYKNDLSPSVPEHFLHSDDPSRLSTRASQMPNLKYGNSLHKTIPLLSSEINECNEPSIQRNVDDKSLIHTQQYNSTDPVFALHEDESDEATTISVGNIRRKLTQKEIMPGKVFYRDPQDPSASTMKEPWDSKISRIQKSSPYGSLPNWKLVAAIIKWGDDLRQEMMCWQLLVQFKNTWNEENVPLWIRPYKVMVLSSEGGLIEPICNAVSLHQIKKQCNMSLVNYFIHEFGDTNSESFLNAQKNFVESCAAYCLVCYFIQVKDRHNGNILLDSSGRIIHIDFGFILAHSPGSNMRFESSPFKLTEEFIDVMGGINSDMYHYFKFLMLKGFLAARKHMDRFINIVNITQTGSKLSCFGNGPVTVEEMKKRFCLSLTEEQLENFVNKLIQSSMNSLTTKLYDGFQYLANGIL